MITGRGATTNRAFTAVEAIPEPQQRVTSDSYRGAALFWLARSRPSRLGVSKGGEAFEYTITRLTASRIVSPNDLVPVMRELLVGKLLAHEDADVAGLAAASGLFITD